MDKFDLKKYLTEGKILKENTSEFPEYKEGEIFLERYEHSNIVERFSKNLSKEEYDFYVKNGEDAFFEEKYVGSFGIDELVDDNEEVRKEEFSLGNDEYNMNLIPIEENKSTTQLKENTSKFPEYEEGKTFLERIEYMEIENRYLKDLSKEEYDYWVTNGQDAFFDRYSDSFDEFSFINRPVEYNTKDDKFQIIK